MNDLKGIISAGQGNTVTVVYHDNNVAVEGVSVTDNNGCVIVDGVYASDDGKGNVTIFETAPCVLVGIISASQEILGNVATSLKLNGSISVGGGMLYPMYEGECEVTPSAFTDIILNTAETYVNQDIVINKILYAEVSNTSGGSTVTIGSEV